MRTFGTSRESRYYARQFLTSRIVWSACGEPGHHSEAVKYIRAQDMTLLGEIPEEPTTGQFVEVRREFNPDLAEGSVFDPHPDRRQSWRIPWRF